MVTVYGEENDLVLNIEKTKELILDFRRRPPPLQPLTIKGIEVERTDSHKFLGLHISEKSSAEAALCQGTEEGRSYKSNPNPCL